MNVLSFDIFYNREIAVFGDTGIPIPVSSELSELCFKVSDDIRPTSFYNNEKFVCVISI